MLDMVEILHQIMESVYENDADMAICRSGVEVVLKQSTEEIRKNRECHPRAMFIEEFLENPREICSLGRSKIGIYQISMSTKLTKRWKH